jgi:soluble lytic murein transglycosylase-like protein
MIANPKSSKKLKSEIKVSGSPRPRPRTRKNVKSAPSELLRTRKILELIAGVKAGKLAVMICKASRATRIGETVIMATAYVESGFDMHSKPCVGIMQLWIPTWKSEGDTRLNPWNPADNIMLGAQELARLKPRASNSKLKTDNEESLKIMWGKYNGSGKNGRYARRAYRVYQRLNKPIERIKQELERGDLWK